MGRLIGAAVPRPRARQLVAGRGRYTDDVRLPGMLHAAFLRSPHGHARIAALDLRPAQEHPGVAAVFDGAAIARVCRPWTAKLGTATHHRSAPQPAVALDRALWQGQPVALVVAESRAAAEDAAALIQADFEELDALVDRDRAFEQPVLHPELGTNICFERAVSAGEPEKTFAGAQHVVRQRLRFGRHTGVPLESRSIVADFDASLKRLTVHQSTQVPHQARAMYAELLGLSEADVRVVVPDVGGGFGVKMHLYDDETAVLAASMLLGRPVKFVADRLEAFASDIHARGHTVEAAIAFNSDGTVLGFDVEDVCEIGAYSIYPRTSSPEGWHAVMMTGAPYAAPALRGRTRVVFQNKSLVGAYRGVGQPIACTITEHLMDAAAAQLGMDPAELRLRNLRRAGVHSSKTPGGVDGPHLTHTECLRRLLTLMDYRGLRAQQAEARRKGRHLGIGLAVFLEITAPGSNLWGPSGMQIICGDGCTVRLEPTGTVTCITSATDQGQGSDAGITQVVADTLGLKLEQVRLIAHDTAVTAVGGGTWASRGLSIGGEAAAVAAAMLSERLLDIAAAHLRVDRMNLMLVDGSICDKSGAHSIALATLGSWMHYHPDRLPAGMDLNPIAMHYFVPQRPYLVPNGVQGSLIELDADSGIVKPLKHWVVEDCGRIINPLLVDEQIRGGVVQGLGGALLEECRYDERGQLQTSTLADYLVPMATDMPDIVIDHVCTPVEGTLLGVKGVGEAGTIGAAAALLNAVNDALRPLSATVSETPCTPERILRALKRVP